MAKFKRSLAKFSRRVRKNFRTIVPKVSSRLHSASNRLHSAVTSPAIRMVGRTTGRALTTSLGAAGTVAAGSVLLHLANPSYREKVLKSSGIADKIINATPKHKAILTFGAVAKHVLRRGGETRKAMGLATVAGAAAHTPLKKYITDPISLATKNAAQGISSGMIKKSGLHDYVTVMGAEALKGELINRILKKKHG